MLEMPDASPTWSADTAAVDAEEAGPLQSPRPTERTTSGPTSAAYVQLDCTKAMTANPPAVSTKPSATTLAAPNLTASGVMNGVTAIITAAAGSVARPAWSALIANAAGSW